MKLSHKVTPYCYALTKRGKRKSGSRLCEREPHRSGNEINGLYVQDSSFPFQNEQRRLVIP